MRGFKKGKGHPGWRHGMSWDGPNKVKRHPIYLSWVNMRQRCNNPDTHDFKYYGARGIKVCKRWNKFEAFLEDMGNAYKAHKQKNVYTTLDRTDVNKGYSPANCRWVTRREQSNNRNYNRLITYKGKTQSCGKWVKELPFKISGKDLHRRIFTREWSLDRAFTQPPRVFK